LLISKESILPNAPLQGRAVDPAEMAQPHVGIRPCRRNRAETRSFASPLQLL
jgi:hypothetical protein